MFDALYIGATGMQAQQLNVDTVANNLANVNTTGFKKARVSFSDLMMRETVTPQATSFRDAGVFASPVRLGSGVGVSDVRKSFEMGTVVQTGSIYDVAIRGDGFIEVSLPDGARAFTRGGSLKVNTDGMLATDAGYALIPGISVPVDAQNLSIRADGVVTANLPNQIGAVELGRVELTRFSSPGQLQALGDNVYRATDASGDALLGKPGQDGVGTLAQGFLEGSNVKMVDEMVNLMVAQRAYEASVKVVQASDEMLGMINGLRK